MMNKNQTTKRHLFLAFFFLFPVFPGKSSAPQNLPQGKKRQVEEVRAMLEKLLETKKLIAKEKMNWKISQELLQERLELKKGEIMVLQKKIKDLERNSKDMIAKKEKIVSKKIEIDEAWNVFELALPRIEKKILKILPKFPLTLQKKVMDLSDKINLESTKKRGKVEVRYLHLLGLLSEINRFNSEVTSSLEIVENDDGDKVEVETVYLGLGQGYFVSKKKDFAGVGYPEKGRWVWKTEKGLASQIYKTISILKNKGLAQFVSLPVTIR